MAKNKSKAQKHKDVFKVASSRSLKLKNKTKPVTTSLKKGKAAHNRRQQQRTGGGRPRLQPLTELVQRIVSCRVQGPVATGDADPVVEPSDGDSAAEETGPEADVGGQPEGEEEEGAAAAVPPSPEQAHGDGGDMPSTEESWINIVNNEKVCSVNKAFVEVQKEIQNLSKHSSTLPKKPLQIPRPPPAEQLNVDTTTQLFSQL